MITYLKGSATEPQGVGNKVVAHVCNDIGAWGRGFVLSLSKKWPEAERSYRRWYQEQDEVDEYKPMILGKVMLVPVADGITVANMIGQHGILRKEGCAPPIRYGAIEECLLQVATFARDTTATVHMPRFGCGLAGGKWSLIEPIVQRALHDIDVFVYDLEGTDPAIVPWKS